MRFQEFSVSERILLAEKLWDSIADDDDAIVLTEEQKKELDRRLQILSADQEIGSSWEDVKKRIIHK